MKANEMNDTGDAVESPPESNGGFKIAAVAVVAVAALASMIALGESRIQNATIEVLSGCTVTVKDDGYSAAQKRFINTIETQQCGSFEAVPEIWNGLEVGETYDLNVFESSSIMNYTLSQ